MGKYKKQAGIYLILNLLNRKVYVGYSEIIKKRLAHHKNRLRRKSHRNKHLQDSWNLYGEQMFNFSIIEYLPDNMSIREYEEVETKWVLYYKSHLSEFGYNGCLPGNYPIKEKEGNRIIKKPKINPIIVVDLQNKEILEYKTSSEIVNKYNIKYNKLTDYLNYWRGIGKRKSYKGFSFVRKIDFVEDIDYYTFKKTRKLKYGRKTNWRDYYKSKK